MPNRLIFLRHGIRGVILDDFKKEVECLPLIASGKNLSYHGYIYSIKVGKFIKKRYGKPNFIYGDVSTNRTIDTAIAVAQGAKVNKIWIADGTEDTYFNSDSIITEESINNSRELLEAKESMIQKIKAEVQKIIPCLKLKNSSEINDNGYTKGLFKQLEKIYTLSVFSILSGVKEPFYQLLKPLDPIRDLRCSLVDPTFASIKPKGITLISGIINLLQKYELSVVIGHEGDLSLLSLFLDQKYKVPEYGLNYIPPNSGFIFSLEKGRLYIEIVYLTLKGKFKIIPYKIVDIPDNLKISEFNLTSYNVLSIK